MRKRFVACVSCGRHVREGDPSCPFCAAPAPELPPPARTLGARVSRAAMLAAGAAGGVIVMVDCGNTSVQAFYGVACTDGGCIGVEVDASDARLPGEASVNDAKPESEAEPPDAADAASEASGDAGSADAGADGD